MTDQLLLTKLCMPNIRSELVSRPRLLARLDSGLAQKGGFERKLTLISAPAGYGKTTLVVEWLRRSGYRIAWLNLDETDNDPARFQAYLLASLGQLQEGLGDAAGKLLRSPQPPPPEVILTVLVNELTKVLAPFALVLDDYHVIQTPVIHRQVAFILDHLPASMHVALLTREDPLIPISRLRARGQLLEIRQEELLFTLEETGDFLYRVMGLNLSPSEIDALERRTEGWITGLQLAALAMQGRQDLSLYIRDFTGSSRYILDYLVEEVFTRQPQEIQDFLLKTSILERLSAGVCDAVTGHSGGKEMLQHLEKSNLFTLPLDPTPIWYRYHHLFSELLRHRLRTSGILEPALHQQASRWFESEGYIGEAIQHAFSAQDWKRAAGLIVQTAEDLLKRGELVTLIGWMEKLPGEIVNSQYDLCIDYAWSLLLIGRYNEAEALLILAEKLSNNDPISSGHVAAAQAFLARSRGDNQQVIIKSQQALSLLPESEQVTRGSLLMNLGLVYWHTGALSEAHSRLIEAARLGQQTGNMYSLLTSQIFLARTLASQGALHQAAEMYPQIIETGGQAPVMALAYYDLATLHYEWNGLEETAQYLSQGMELSLRSANREFENAGWIMQALLLLAQGDINGALHAINRSHIISRDFNPATQARSAACHVQIALAGENLEDAMLWAEKVTEDADAHSFYRFLGLTQPRLLIAQGKKKAAVELLSACSHTAERGGWGYGHLAVRVLQSLAAEKQEQALEYLMAALHQAKPDGYIRTFVDAGERLIPLLQEAARRGIYPEYVGVILEAMKAGIIKVAPSQSALLEPLSQRELEVLRLVTVGLSNREIASQLFISPGTAKTHLHNICAKLSVRNRTEAVMRAKELHLV